MLRVRLITDPFDLASYSEHEVPELVPFLGKQFPTWPATARLYRDVVAVEHDVTPRCEEDLAALDVTDGLFYVVVYPGNPVTAIITAVAVLVLATAMFLFLMPKIPKAGDNQESSNNSLGHRVNRPRPNGRIPDIFGTVVSIPEMLTVPLLFFEDNMEREVCFMCVGRGMHDIEAVKDGDTPLEQIAGAGANFYGPETSPNSGLPFLNVGSDIDVPLLDVIKINDVNGQILRAPNANQVSGDSDIRFVYPDTIERTGGAIDFSAYFGPGDQLTVVGSSFSDDPGLTEISETARFTYSDTIEFDTFDPSTVFSTGQFITIINGAFAGDDGVGGVLYVDLSGTYEIVSVTSSVVTLSAPEAINPDWDVLDNFPGDHTSYRLHSFSVPGDVTGYNLDGTYNVVSVSASEIVLTNPVLVNAAWGNLDDLPGDATAYLSPSLSTAGERWIGPFVVDMPECTQVVVNLFAAQGMYLLTKKGKYRSHSVTLEVEVTPVDADGLPTGAPVTTPTTIFGDGQDRSPKGVTLWVAGLDPSRQQVRVRRLTDFDLETEDTIVDEVKWRDAYGTAEVDALHFGDLTTVHSLTLATSGATNVKERKFNCRATRQVLVRNVDDTFGPGLAASRSAADIICHMALDPHLGGRSLSELDVQQIYDTVDDVATYFGFDDAGEFSYTFDQDSISFEEMVQAAAQAVFCTAYRQGSILRLFFERETEDSVLLFNHRNKSPGSETRTVRFGTFNDHDGVEVDYVSGRDGAKLTLYLPEDQSATKPKKIDLVGVVDRRGDAAVPSLHANRAWAKIRYQHTTSEFQALAEASQLVLNQRVENTDNTRPDVIDGEVCGQDGLVLHLSQPFEPVEDVDYTIFLQLSDGSVETRVCTAGPDNMSCTLALAPSLALVTDSASWALTTYQIVGSQDVRPSAFLVSSKGAFEKDHVPVQIINYDPRYYAYDSTYLP